MSVHSVFKTRVHSTYFSHKTHCNYHFQLTTIYTFPLFTDPLTSLFNMVLSEACTVVGYLIIL